MGDKSPILRVFANVRGFVRIPEPRAINLRLNPSYFEPRTRVSLLRKTFAGPRM